MKKNPIEGIPGDFVKYNINNRKKFIEGVKAVS